jgi:Holliday junction resolvasome RuvABC endonuclease subunit
MTSMGWVRLLDEPGTLDIEASGCWNSKHMQELHGDVGRWLPMRYMLDEQGGDCDFIAVEKVAHQNALWSAHMYGGHRAVIELWCYDNKKPLVLVPVQTAKKALTGNGGATKDMMLAHARKKFPETRFAKHDVADALGIALGGKKLYGEAMQRM